jgi:hypothetical protein
VRIPTLESAAGVSAAAGEDVAAGNHIVLWATDEGLPLEMTMGEKNAAADSLPLRVRSVSCAAVVQHGNSGRL